MRSSFAFVGVMVWFAFPERPRNEHLAARRGRRSARARLGRARSRLTAARGDIDAARMEFEQALAHLDTFPCRTTASGPSEEHS